jgi:hypothetical protein
MDLWIREQLFSLGILRRIDEARVRFERLEDASPAYLVRIHLVTPGPDLFVESRDHTLRAAFEKGITQIRSKMAGRIQKRMDRLKLKF